MSLLLPQQWWPSSRKIRRRLEEEVSSRAQPSPLSRTPAEISRSSLLLLLLLFFCHSLKHGCWLRSVEDLLGEVRNTQLFVGGGNSSSSSARGSSDSSNPSSASAGLHTAAEQQRMYAWPGIMASVAAAAVSVDVAADPLLWRGEKGKNNSDVHGLPGAIGLSHSYSCQKEVSSSATTAGGKAAAIAAATAAERREENLQSAAASQRQVGTAASPASEEEAKYEARGAILEATPPASNSNNTGEEAKVAAAAAATQEIRKEGGGEILHRIFSGEKTEKCGRFATPAARITAGAAAGEATPPQPPRAAARGDAEAGGRGEDAATRGRGEGKHTRGGMLSRNNLLRMEPLFRIAWVSDLHLDPLYDAAASPEQECRHPSAVAAAVAAALLHAAVGTDRQQQQQEEGGSYAHSEKEEEAGVAATTPGRADPRATVAAAGAAAHDTASAPQAEAATAAARGDRGIFYAAPVAGEAAVGSGEKASAARTAKTNGEESSVADKATAQHKNTERAASFFLEESRLQGQQQHQREKRPQYLKQQQGKKQEAGHYGRLPRTDRLRRRNLIRRETQSLAETEDDLHSSSAFFHRRREHDNKNRKSSTRRNDSSEIEGSAGEYRSSSKSNGSSFQSEDSSDPPSSSSNNTRGDGSSSSFTPGGSSSSTSSTGVEVRSRRGKTEAAVHEAVATAAGEGLPRLHAEADEAAAGDATTEDAATPIAEEEKMKERVFLRRSEAAHAVERELLMLFSASEEETDVRLGRAGCDSPPLLLSLLLDSITREMGEELPSSSGGDQKEEPSLVADTAKTAAAHAFLPSADGIPAAVSSSKSAWPDSSLSALSPASSIAASPSSTAFSAAADAAAPGPYMSATVASAAAASSFFATESPVSSSLAAASSPASRDTSAAETMADATEPQQLRRQQAVAVPAEPFAEAWGFLRLTRKSAARFSSVLQRHDRELAATAAEGPSSLLSSPQQQQHKHLRRQRDARGQQQLSRRLQQQQHSTKEGHQRRPRRHELQRKKEAEEVQQQTKKKKKKRLLTTETPEGDEEREDSDFRYKKQQQQAAENQTGSIRNIPIEALLVTGDIAAHYGELDAKLRMNAIKAASSILFSRFSAARHEAADAASPAAAEKAGGLQMIFVAGNNDLPMDYYIPDRLNAWSKALYTLWREHALPTDAATKETFERGLYYTTTLWRRPEIKILALNTIFYSREAWRSAVAKLSMQGKLQEVINGKYDLLTNSDPAGQFAWMEKQLEEARVNRQQVLLVGHVPPGISHHFDRRLRHVHQWREHFLVRYRALASKYTDIILAHLYGHTHADTVKLLATEPAGDLQADDAFDPFDAAYAPSTPSRLNLFSAAARVNDARATVRGDVGGERHVVLGGSATAAASAAAASSDSAAAASGLGAAAAADHAAALEGVFDTQSDKTAELCFSASQEYQPVLTCPAVSPFHGNNPAWRVLVFGVRKFPTAAAPSTAADPQPEYLLLDHTQFYVPLYGFTLFHRKPTSFTSAFPSKEVARAPAGASACNGHKICTGMTSASQKGVSQFPPSPSGHSHSPFFHPTGFAEADAALPAAPAAAGATATSEKTIVSSTTAALAAAVAFGVYSAAGLSLSATSVETSAPLRLSHGSVDLAGDAASKLGDASSCCRATDVTTGTSNKMLEFFTEYTFSQAYDLRCITGSSIKYLTRLLAFSPYMYSAYEGHVFSGGHLVTNRLRVCEAYVATPQDYRSCVRLHNPAL